jgi:hypothetical protein
MIRQESTIDNISVWYIWYKRIFSYIRTGFILHAFSIIVFSLFLLCYNQLSESKGFILLVFSLLSMFLFSISITSQLDAYSRYQDYKRVKDLLYKHGFRELFMKPYSRSRCQRNAISEAALQLGILPLINSYFYQAGYRWYHIIPSILIENPLVIFTRGYWYSTFFVPKYESKFFYW